MMKRINEYISEKLIVNNTIQNNNYDINNVKFIFDLLKATYIAIMNNMSYKSIGLSKQAVKRSEISYELIFEILTKYYKYELDKSEIVDKNGTVYKVLKEYIKRGYIDDLINGKNILIKPIKGYNNLTEYKEISERNCLDDWYNWDEKNKK